MREKYWEITVHSNYYVYSDMMLVGAPVVQVCPSEVRCVQVVISPGALPRLEASQPKCEVLTCAQTQSALPILVLSWIMNDHHLVKPVFHVCQIQDIVVKVRPCIIQCRATCDYRARPQMYGFLSLC